MILKEFSSMLLGTVHFKYSDHKNLAFATLNCCCIFYWHLYVKKYGPTSINLTSKMPLPRHSHSSNAMMCCPLWFISKSLNISNDPDLFEFFCNLPLAAIAENNTIAVKWIHSQQIIGTVLATKTTKYIDTSIILLMVVWFYVMPFQMRIAWHNGKIHKRNGISSSGFI